MKNTIILLITALAFCAPARSQGPLPRGSVIQPGEVLRYKVRWTLFRLGTLTLKAVRDSGCAGADDIRLVMIVESNPDLSFIWIREFNECLVDTRTFAPALFHARHRNGEEYTEIWHDVDRERHRTVFRLQDRNTGALLGTDTLRGVEWFVEGPSLFYIARCLSGMTGTRTVPTLVGGKLSTTDLCYGGEKMLIDIAASAAPVRVRKFTGEAHWKGGTEAGLEGGFTGWVSDDDAAVPVAAELKVLLGSVRLELESWSRDGWTPPSGDILTQNDTYTRHMP